MLRHSDSTNSRPADRREPVMVVKPNPQQRHVPPGPLNMRRRRRLVRPLLHHLLIPRVALVRILALVQPLGLDMLAQNIPFKDVPNLADTIRSMHMRRHAENLIQLLEGLPLSLGQEQQHEEKADDIPGGVPAKRALRRKSLLQARPRDGEHAVEEPGGGGGQAHAVGADVQRVGFGGVGEGDGAFAGGVDDAEEVDAEGDAGDAGGVHG